MSFHEVRLDEDIAYESAGGPQFLTDIVVMGSGHERRNARWSESRLKWDLSYGIVNQDRLERLIKFFVARQGRAYGFRFKDWSDYQCLDVDGTVEDLGNDTFQLYKKYVSWNITFLRKISKPVSGTISVYKNQVLTPVQLDVTDGTFVLLNVDPQQDVLTWSGEFDVPVRFDTDHLSTRLDAYESTVRHGAFTVGSVPIVEIRV